MFWFWKISRRWCNYSKYTCSDRAVEFVYIPDSVQDAGDWGKNLHLSEDWDSQVYLATEAENEKKKEEKDRKKDQGKVFWDTERQVGKAKVQL